MVKKIFSLILIFSFSLFLCACENQKGKHVSSLKRLRNQDTIIIGVKSDSEPFGFFEDGKYKGFDIDVAEYVLKNLLPDYKNKEIKFTEVTPQDRIMKLNSGEVDLVVATMSITNARSQVVDFTDPYFVAGQAVLVPNNSKIRGAEDLNSKDVAVILGSTGERTLREFAPNVLMTGCRGYKEALKMLQDGQVIAIYGDDSILYGIIAKNKGFKILNKRYTKEYYAIALRKEDNNTDLIKQINTILQDMQKTGKLNALKKKWISSGNK